MKHSKLVLAIVAILALFIGGAALAEPAPVVPTPSPATPTNYGGSGSGSTTSKVDMNWESQVFAVPGQGGMHSNNTIVVYSNGNYVQPPTGNTPPAQGNTPASSGN
ncbi:MAG: hypothetical protein P8Y13_13725 [Deinococcales bacterium]